MSTNARTICPYCGADNVDGNYNYDTANVEYECNFCGETFTDKDLVYCEKCGIQLMYDNVYHDNEGDTICQVCLITKK